MPYQVFINECCATGKTDIDWIFEAMVVKKPSLGPILRARGFYFTIKSEFKQGKWITLGVKETVVEGKELRLKILNNIEIIKMDQSTELTLKAKLEFISSTFNGRRKVILDGKYTDIYDIMKRHCPVLNQANYLRIEFEMYVGKEVRDFMAKWSEYVPLILKVAKKSAPNNKKMRNLVDFYRRTSDIYECFGI
ncbi:hypothetical protein OUZ56_009788 [Daphnia magna]|uniref:CYTH domain-containing protein n=1 Tax=Daphnia magna TaxID=35525 RepID=A0ABR0AGX5_9CRUS|nr:hypothetical protein OUZ56_009788 [Daphnia magna]